MHRNEEIMCVHMGVLNVQINVHIYVEKMKFPILVYRSPNLIALAYITDGIYLAEVNFLLVSETILRMMHNNPRS